MQRLLILLFLLLATALKTFAYYETALLLRLPGQQFFIFLKTSPKEKMHFFLNNTLEKRATGQKTGLNYLSYGLQNLFIPQIVPSKGGDASALWRYELATGTKQNVTNYGEVRRGKNGKMYVSVANTQNLKEVSAPDGTVSVANFQATAVSGEKLVGVLPLQPNRTLPEVEDSLFARELGKRVYEIGDFLSNARVITSDRKLSTISGGIPTNFTADIKTYYNHLPGGMLAPSRSMFPENYTFSYNGKLMDNEVYGITGSWYDYGERPYMPLIMRFPSPDPLIVKQQQYPELSSYQYASNSPVWAVDLDGLEAKPATAPDINNMGKTQLAIDNARTVLPESIDSRLNTPLAITPKDAPTKGGTTLTSEAFGKFDNPEADKGLPSDQTNVEALLGLRGGAKLLGKIGKLIDITKSALGLGGKIGEGVDNETSNNQLNPTIQEKKFSPFDAPGSELEGKEFQMKTKDDSVITTIREIKSKDTTEVERRSKTTGGKTVIKKDDTK